MESIINAKKQEQIIEQSNKKVRELELKIKKLELRVQDQEEELQRLKLIEKKYKMSTVELTQLKEENKRQSQIIEDQNETLRFYEKQEES